jgi:Domain of unknown function (DUF4351)
MEKCAKSKVQFDESIDGKKEAQTLILRQLNRRAGVMSLLELQLRVKALSLARLEELSEALLDFS